MKFTRTPPVADGTYWCYLKDPKGVSRPTLETGTVRNLSPNPGHLRVVNGAFDFDWGDWLWWGDRIELPTSVELQA